MLVDEFRGVEMIPLNRLSELPQNIVEQIEPVFFPEEKWNLTDNIMNIPEANRGNGLSIKLNDHEIMALKDFEKQINLSEVARRISSVSGISPDEAYITVTALFFKLASMRICHPKAIYRIDELVKEKKQK